MLMKVGEVTHGGQLQKQSHPGIIHLLSNIRLLVYNVLPTAYYSVPTAYYSVPTLLILIRRYTHITVSHHTPSHYRQAPICLTPPEL